MSQATRSLSTDAYTRPGIGADLSDNLGTIPTPTPEQVHAARLQVAGHARDVAEAREMLTMLDLPWPGET